MSNQLRAQAQRTEAVRPRYLKSVRLTRPLEEAGHGYHLSSEQFVMEMTIDGRFVRVSKIASATAPAKYLVTLNMSTVASFVE